MFILVFVYIASKKQYTFAYLSIIFRNGNWIIFNYNYVLNKMCANNLQNV